MIPRLIPFNLDKTILDNLIVDWIEQCYGGGKQFECWLPTRRGKFSGYWRTPSGEMMINGGIGLYDFYKMSFLLDKSNWETGVNWPSDLEIRTEDWLLSGWAGNKIGMECITNLSRIATLAKISYETDCNNVAAGQEMIILVQAMKKTKVSNAARHMLNNAFVEKGFDMIMFFDMLKRTSHDAR